jgi:Cu/Ag efflux protein CusF
MSIRRSAFAFVTASLFAGTAFAGTTPAPAPAPAPAASTSAVTHATGVVKAWNAQTHQLTVTVNGKDVVYSTGSLTLDPAVKVGATVDVTLTGAKVTAVALHKV